MEMVRMFYDNGEKIDVAFISAGVFYFFKVIFNTL